MHVYARRMAGTGVDDESAGRARTWLLARPAPLAGAAVLAGGAVLVATNDPSAAGSRFPACVVRTWTGLWCPGCGLTRGTHELLNGDVVAALGYNLFVPVALVGIALAWWAWCSASWGVAFMPRRLVEWAGPPNSRRQRRADVALWGLFALLITYGVLRNIPVDPFTALAP